MKLKTYIEGKGGVPGATPAGRAWALKALHPADPIVEVTGIPDEDAYQTVFQHYQFQINVTNPTPATVGTWEFDLFCLPDPVIVAGLRTKDSNGSYLWSPVLNEQVGAAGASYTARKTYFMGQVERYRIGYYSVTGHLDAAAVTNQGMIACAQYPVATERWSYQIQAPAATYAHRTGAAWTEAPKTYAQLQTMPNSYLGEARAGVYAVYKLSETCQKWRMARDTRTHLPYGAASGLFDDVATVYPAAATSTTTVSGCYPYGVSGAYTGAAAKDMVVLRRADSGLMHISGRNLHYQSSMTFVLRIGYELQVNAGSPLTSFARVSPQHDPVALSGYFAIARELKDAYPEDYNSFGALLGTIANIAKAVLPVIAPGISNAIGKFLGPAPTAQAERVIEAAPAAAKEKAQDDFKRASEESPSKSKKKKKTKMRPIRLRK